MENNESVDSELSEQLNENTTCLENADPVVETGDELKENKTEEEIRRSVRIKRASRTNLVASRQQNQFVTGR